MFEFGSGGSTIFFAKRVKNLVSVEHDEDWYILVKNLLKKANISNVEYKLLKPKAVVDRNMNAEDPDSYGSGFKKEYSSLDFSEYVKEIDNYPDERFNLIIIDGRSRPSCIKHSIKKLNKNGLIILDNANRKRYNLSKKKYLYAFRSKRFIGIGPYNLEPWETAVFFK